MEYILHLFIIIAFYTLLSQSLNFFAGFTRLISLAQAGFYGIGAYTTAILSIHYGLPFWINIVIAMLLNGIIALIISLIIMRTIEDYFIICTLGIQVIIFSIVNNWMPLTNGPIGISGIPSLFFRENSFYNKIFFLILASFFVTIVWLMLKKLSNSGFGNILKAIGEDEIYTQSVGKNVYLSKIISFIISAILTAIPGVLYAHYFSYIDPTSFTITESIFILSIVIIGGLGDFTGSFLAAIFVVLFPEVLRVIGMPNNIAANVRQLIYGVILVAIVMTDKKGIKKPSNKVFTRISKIV